MARRRKEQDIQRPSSLRRDGWLDDRAFAVLREPETGEAIKFVCLECDAETEADRDVFIAHRCDNYSIATEGEMSDA